MKKEHFPYVVLIPKRQWSEYETAKEIVGVYQSTFDVLNVCPRCSRIMTEYEFFKELNDGVVNTKANWVIGVHIEQTLAEYYKMEAR